VNIKKIDQKQDKQHNDFDKVWCYDMEGFQYVKACKSNCKKKDKCSTFKDYLEPTLFKKLPLH
jgi:hypothetical protein